MDGRAQVLAGEGARHPQGVPPRRATKVQVVLAEAIALTEPGAQRGGDGRSERRIAARKVESCVKRENSAKVSAEVEGVIHRVMGHVASVRTHRTIDLTVTVTCFAAILDRGHVYWLMHLQQCSPNDIALIIS